jgi:hypothetical protein
MFDPLDRIRDPRAPLVDPVRLRLPELSHAARELLAARSGRMDARSR